MVNRLIMSDTSLDKLFLEAFQVSIVSERDRCNSGSFLSSLRFNVSS